MWGDLILLFDIWVHSKCGAKTQGCYPEGVKKPCINISVCVVELVKHTKNLLLEMLSNYYTLFFGHTVIPVQCRIVTGMFG